MTIPFHEQYYVERDRNFKYLFLSVLVSVLLPVFHGIIFLWVPWILRGKRNAEGLRYKPFFASLKYWEAVTQTFCVTFLGRPFYFQPSLLLVAAFHIGIHTIFAISETKDLTYETWYYIVSKRVGRLSIAHVPVIFILVTKNNLFSAASGLTSDKVVFFHKWYGRSMFVTAIIHMALALKYWLGMQFDIMVKIPPQIFGFIAFSCLGVLNLASLRFVRNFAFDFFLAQHRFFNFVMTLLAYFHNGGNHAAVILGVHLLVVDRIVGRVIGILHKRKGPTKGRCDFEILDDSTVRVSIPISIRKNNGKWYWCFVPRYGSWRAGQHVLFNCNKVALLAYHPFTISSLPDSGKMVLVIKVQKGFTKQLHKRLNKMAAEEDPESSVETTTGVNPEVCDSFTESIRSTDQLKTCSQEKEVDILAKSVESFQNLISSFQSPRIFNIKAGINGPFGANYQPLTKFDSVVFFSAGSGASFTLPVALDLLKTLQQRDGLDDYLYRPKHAQITLVFSIKYLANLQWYDHLWKEFIPFFNSGRARLCLHVTQEGSQAQDVLEIQEVSEGQEVSGLSEDEQYLKKEKFEVTREFSTVSREGNSTSSDSVLDTAKCGFSLSYGRPDIESIVTTSVGKVCSPTYRKAFACISCGPRAFNSRVKKACERNRWVPNAPDVYCYQESFG